LFTTSVSIASRVVGHDAPLFPRHRVDQRGFARVRLTDDGHLDHIADLFLRFLRRQIFEHRVEQIAGPGSMHGGHRHRIPQPEIVKFIKFRRQFADPVAFIDAQHNRLAAFLQHGRHIGIVGRDSGVQIGDEDNHVGLFHGELRLTAHLPQEDIVGLRFDTARVREQKRTAPPFAGGENPIPRHAGCIFDNGQPLADEFIEQRGFSHIRAADNSHDRPRHTRPSFFIQS